ncbi:hypothetical protein RN607_14340 [Demequina capsici]|uniref:Uncharacterized protein n=1 Tax=Demequina capsici TaxID=3075620 RepID=A0AA96JFY3_9MICO|nr:hypothetical protein [Demequina sp. PMTSA13]WNM27359.1 hypothetical protein RN607_14340 [Demequina sp. PMTSA13]
MTGAMALFSVWPGVMESAVYEAPAMHDVEFHADWMMTSGGQTSTSGVFIGLRAETDVPDGAAMAQQLKDESGLTADQLGKMLGVTRRSVHNWAAGAAIAPKHQARLQQLHDLVFELEATNLAERRDILLDSATGPSLYRQFADGTTRAARVEYPVPMIERFA